MIIEVKHVILNSSHKDYGRHFRISLRSDNDNAYFVRVTRAIKKQIII